MKPKTQEEAMQQVFINFLIYNNAYEQFCKELKDQRDMTIGHYLQIHPPKDYILCAFLWYDTDHEEMWENLNQSWEEHINHLITQ